MNEFGTEMSILIWYDKMLLMVILKKSVKDGHDILPQVSGHILNLYYKNLHKNIEVDFPTLSCRLQGEICARDKIGKS